MNRLPYSYAFKNPLKRIAVFLFDSLGYLIFFPFRVFRRPDSEKIRRVLAVRLDHLGDVVMTLPALAKLREKYPQANIDLLTSREAAVLFEGREEIDSVIGFKNNWFSRDAGFTAILKEFGEIRCVLRNGRYDLAIDFRGDLRNIFLIWLARIPRRLGYGVTGGGFLLTQSRDYDRSIHQTKLNLNLLEPFSESGAISVCPFKTHASGEAYFDGMEAARKAVRPRIVLHVGAGYASKRWPAEYFKEVIRQVGEEALGQVILIGTAAEKEWLAVSPEDKHVLDLRGLTRLSDLPAVLSAADYFVGNDSGPAHIAAVQGIPGTVIFSGTNDKEIWRPWSDKLKILTHAVECSPCGSRECPLKHHDCMRQITVDTVLNEIREFSRKKITMTEKRQ